LEVVTGSILNNMLYLCDAVVLGDSVLGFHKHGMQGLSLATNEVSSVVMCCS